MIKHTPNETYNVYSCIRINNSGIKIWYPYKHYRSKQAAINAIKKFKEKNSGNEFVEKMIFKILWCPYPFASDKECIKIWEG